MKPHHAALLCLLLAGSVLAAPGDENWATTWNLPGADDEVHDAVEFQGDLVIVGRFHAVGDAPAPGVAIFDGTAWAGLGDGIHGEVYDAQVYGGLLYVCGDLRDAGDNALGGMARWNGSAWEFNPLGPVDYVNGMAVLGSQLVIMGDFGEVDGQFIDSFAMWDGAQWNGTGAGFAYGSDITSDGSNVYATGQFEWIGDTYAAHVARWDGSQWHAMGGGLTDEFGDPYDAYGESIHAWNGMVAVTGEFARAGGQDLANFAVWDGSGWGALGSDPAFFGGDFPIVIGDHDGDLLVFNGQSFVYRWNGLFWNGIGWGGVVNCAADYGSDLVFGGGFRDMIGVRAHNVARYDGSSWHAMADGNGIIGFTSFGDAQSVHVWNDLLLVGGREQNFYGDDVTGTVLAGWNGADWVDMGLGDQGSSVAQIDCMVTYQGDLVVNGNIDNAGGTPCNSFARYDGTSWSPLGDAVTSSGGSGMVVLDGELYAIVYTPGKVVARYQPGTDSWLTIGDDPPGSDLYELGTFQGDLIVAGSFPSIDGVTANRIARWDGTAWHPLGAGVEGAVRALHEADGKLVVAGSLTAAGGVSVERIAAWDGSVWSTYGDGFYGSVRAVQELGGTLYAAGDFALSSTEPRYNIASWDGGAWIPLGSGLDDFALDLAAYDGDLVVVGEFTSAGGRASSSIAVWSPGTSTGVGDDPRVRPGNLLALGPARPNPFQHGTSVSFTMPRSGDARLDVLDVRGRRIAGRVLRGLNPGVHTATWDGKGRDGRAAAAGTYFLRVRAAGVEGVRRVAVVR